MSKLLKDTTSQLLMIDIQERLLPAMDDPDRVMKACTILMDAASLLGIPITISEQYPKGLGPTVPQLKNEKRQADVFEKTHFSCLGDESLSTHLEEYQRSGRTQIVIAGIEAHICVLQTALACVDAGFETYIVSDATGSRKTKSQDLAEDRLRSAGGQIITLEMALFEWLGKAGSEEFKTLSKRIK